MTEIVYAIASVLSLCAIGLSISAMLRDRRTEKLIEATRKRTQARDQAEGSGHAAHPCQGPPTSE